MISRTEATRGVTYTDVVLNVSTLAGLISDPYYSDFQKWRRVICTYIKDFQRKTIEFRNVDFYGTSAPDSFQNATLRFSEEALTGVWALSRVVIRDFDGGSLTLGQSDLPTGLDITVS